MSSTERIEKSEYTWATIITFYCQGAGLVGAEAARRREKKRGKNREKKGEKIRGKTLEKKREEEKEKKCQPSNFQSRRISERCFQLLSTDVLDLSVLTASKFFTSPFFAAMRLAVM